MFDRDTYKQDGKYYAASPVAQVGDEKYTNLAEAVSAAKGNPVVLLQDVDQAAIGALKINKGQDITLDLNGHSVRCSNSQNGYIYIQGKLTLKDSQENSAGRIYSDSESNYVSGKYDKTLIFVEDGGEFVMESGRIETVMDDAANKGQFAIGVWGTGKVTINGGTINAGWYAITGSGDAEPANTSITVNGGTLVSTADYAIYHPQTGTLTINGGTVYGEAGAVAMKRGKLVVNDGTLTSKGKGNTGTWGNGTGNLKNAALNFTKLYGPVTATIKGGKITSEGDALLIDAQPTEGKKADIAIFGGTFSSDVTDLLGENSEATKDADGNYTVRTYYAQVGNEKYTSLAEAVSAAKGNPVVLLQDVDQAAIGALKINKGQDITLDLNGHSVRCSNSQNGYIYIQGKLTLKDSQENSAGRIYSDSESNYVSGKYDKTLIFVEDGGEFVMESGRIETVMDDAANKGQFAIGVWGTGKVTINGGTINAGWYAITGSGDAEPANTSITVNGGTLVSTADYAIYHPQTGTLTINGGTVYGEAGAVAMKRGKLVVNDGTLTSKGKGNTGTWGNGTGNLKNAALNFTKLYGPVTATIKGGKITSEGDALLIDAQPTAGKKAVIAISGGTYSSDVTAYCADGFMSTANEDGTYGITEAKDAIFVGQDKNVYLAEGGAASIDWLSLKKVVVANEVKNVSVSLTRDYANTGWNSFCVPFDITLTDEMLKTFDFAEIWDTELDQTTGGTTIEFITCKAGDVLPAYFPCIIKAKEAGKQTLTVENTTLKTPTNKTEGCSTMKQTFTFYGVLEQTYTAEKYGFCLRSSDNALLYNNDKDGYICPFFFYMTIQNKADGSYFIGKNTEESRRVAIHVIGDNEATGISQINMGASSSEEAVYNLQGVRMNGAVKDLPKGVYIRNGHKFVVK